MWGFSWGYVAAFALCMALLAIGMGAPGPGVDGLLDISGRVFFSPAQYFFLGVGVVVAIVRVSNVDVDEETRNQERLEDWQESMESLWEDRPE